MGDTAGQPQTRRSETRFCRIPQWLYGTGVSLQAVAAYGWLHGKYGWLPKINPSYATLAEELGVSRGSVITYFKELIKVGAVRVTAGGPKGRTINTFEIAFEAPFAFQSGQRADHSRADEGSVVSRVTSSGQPADHLAPVSGQRAVPEVEVLKKLEDSLSSDAPVPNAPEPPAPDEREIIAALPKDNDDAGKVVEAWLAARGRGRNPAAEAKVRKSASEFLAADWSIPDLIALAEDMGRRQPTYSDLTKHEPHWVRPVSKSAPAASSATTCWTCTRPTPKPVVAFGRTYCPSCCEPCSGCRAATPADALDMDTNRCPACRTAA